MTDENGVERKLKQHFSSILLFVRNLYALCSNRQLSNIVMGGKRKKANAPSNLFSFHPTSFPTCTLTSPMTSSSCSPLPSLMTLKWRYSFSPSAGSKIRNRNSSSQTAQLHDDELP